MPSQKIIQWFSLIYRYGQMTCSPHLRVYRMKRSHDKPRFGVVVPNTIIPLATKRNLVKRRIVLILRQQQLIAGFDCVVYVKQNIVTLSMEQLTQEVVAALSPRQKA